MLMYLRKLNPRKPVYMCINNKLLHNLKQLQYEYKTQLKVNMAIIRCLLLTFVIVSNIKLQREPKILL